MFPSDVNTTYRYADDVKAHDALLEAFDCFAVAVPFGRAQLQRMGTSEPTLAVELISACALADSSQPPLYLLPLPEIVRRGLDVAEADLCTFLENHSPSVELSESDLVVGRCRLARRKTRLAATAMAQRFTYAFTKPALRLMEQLAVCVRRYEPVLLVGETGTGKTSTVQHLARSLNQE
jgi:ABC-type multidrug transport system fused ATPase/permease subunit